MPATLDRWDPPLKAQHIAWGDIIPPFDYGDSVAPTHFAGLNWDSAGQDIYYGSKTHEGPAVCTRPPPPEQQFGTLSLTKVVTGLPLVGTPVDGTVPTDGFTAHVSCDDGGDPGLHRLRSPTQSATTTPGSGRGSFARVSRRGGPP